ncbi:MAG TPA: hypothetical protein VF516_02340, partial [Kofleriaceae bacterium]
MRIWLLTLAVCACSKDAPAPSRAPVDPAERAAQRTTDGSGAAAPRASPDLVAALVATIPADARVIGSGELLPPAPPPAPPS